MGFTESYAALDEQWVVGARGGFGHRAGRGVSELIRRTDDELRKGIALIESRDGTGPAEGRGRDVRCGQTGGRGRIAVGDKCDLRTLSLQLVERLADNSSVVLRQPVAKEVIWHPDGDGISRVIDKCGGFEPGIETVAVYLGLDSREDLRPDIFGAASWIEGHNDEHLAKHRLVEASGG